MQPVVTNRLLMAVLVEKLAERGLGLEDYERAHDMKPGRMAEVLDPPGDRAINRNIKLIAHHLKIPAADFWSEIEERARLESS